MSPLFITGYLPEHLMKEEYYLEWQRINMLVEKDQFFNRIFDRRRKVI